MVQVAKIISHEGYSSQTLDNDIALIQTASPMTLGQTNSDKIELPTQDSDVTSGTVDVSG